MPENFTDPTGNTEAFRAFANPAQPEAPAPTARKPMIIGAVVVAVVLIALATWLALG